MQSYNNIPICENSSQNTTQKNTEKFTLVKYTDYAGKNKSKPLYSKLYDLQKIGFSVLTKDEKKKISQDPKNVKNYPHFTFCQKFTTQKEVEVRKTKDSTHLGNLASCSRHLRCPICAYKLSQIQNTRLNKIIEKSINEKRIISMQTLTVPHTKKDSLESLNTLLQKSFAQIMNGRKIRKYNLIGIIKRYEITYSKVNGWHPHLHILFIHENTQTLTDINQLHHDVKTAWVKKTNAIYSYQHHTLATPKKLQDYVTKFHLTNEFSSSHTKQTKKKTSLTPFDLLEKAPKCKQSFALFMEYLEATKFKRILTISKSLLDEIKLQDKSDDELLQETVNAITFGTIDTQLWKTIVKNNLQKYIREDLSKYKTHEKQDLKTMLAISELLREFTNVNFYATKQGNQTIYKLTYK